MSIWITLLSLALLLLAVFLAKYMRRRSSSSIAWIEAARLHADLADGARPVIIDVRGPDEFDGELGHLAGAQNIALGELPRRLGELHSFKTQEVVLVCMTQMRSAKAASILDGAGFDKVAVLRGGMAEWGRRRLPVEGGAPAPAAGERRR